MRIETLVFQNFRCIRSLRLDFHPQMNIFVGVNGAGKSSVLDCLAVMLSRFVGRIRSTALTGRFFTPSDITLGVGFTANTIRVTLDWDSSESHLEWALTRQRKKEAPQTLYRFREMIAFAKKLRAQLEEQDTLNIPLTLYYPVNRAVLDIPLRIRKKHIFEQLSAYDQALSGQRNDFRLFFEWFRVREDLENERRVRDPKYRDRQIEAVRKAVEGFLPGFEDLRVQRSPLRMTIQKEGLELAVNQLSDGEKCLLAMVGDLARRLAIANPSLTDPLLGKGVVLIDEVDLHLHPSWQRMVVPLLETTFPECQFVLTTHSAQVLSHVQDVESVFLLRISDEGISADHPESVYGLDSNRILEDIMDVPSRPEEIKGLMEALFERIARGELVAARAQLQQLKGKVRDDPELVKAEVLIRRMETASR
ncbi:MAG: AAA family ATPase [Thermodesulfobacteriota bacterium]